MPTIGETALREGIVYKKSNGLYAVHCSDQTVTTVTTVNCEISSRLRKELIFSGNNANIPHRRVVAVQDIQTVDPLCVGDGVRFVPPDGGYGLIIEVIPRVNHLSRREAVGSDGRHAREQVIVANLDQVVPVMALAQPAPHWNLLDRYLVSAESLGLEALVVMTKFDLAAGDRLSLSIVEEYRAIGYRVILTSAQTGQGLEELAAALKGKVSALIGKSGVGKSSLLNLIQPGLGLRVKEVSAYNGKGRHATTHVEMFELEGGGAVVDTPGTREFGLWQVNGEDLAQYFPEVRALAGACRFSLDCSHNREPGCAVRRAVEDGRITRRRYESMLSLR